VHHVEPDVDDQVAGEGVAQVVLPRRSRKRLDRCSIAARINLDWRRVNPF
jgi:hypothetical protein